jgi:hypothetical protein
MTFHYLDLGCSTIIRCSLTPRLTLCEGKRLVKHLSMDQRARKQAHDREAQRNMRKRTKEHVEFLEEYIKFLESGVEKLQEGMRSENIDSTLKKNQNQELEDENRMLRGQLALRVSEFFSHWVSAPNPPQLPVSTYPNQIYHPTRAYDNAESSQHLYCTTAAPRWDHPAEFEQVSSFGVDAVSARPVSTISRQHCQY